MTGAQIPGIVFECLSLVPPVGVELAHSLLEVPKGLPVEREVVGAADLSSDHQVGVLECPDVFVDCGERHLLHGGQLADRVRLQTEGAYDGSPVRVGESIEYGIQFFVHTRLYS